MINAFTDYDADKPVLIKLCLQNYFCHFLLGDFTDTGFIQEGSCKIQRLQELLNTILKFSRTKSLGKILTKVLKFFFKNARLRYWRN